MKPQTIADLDLDNVPVPGGRETWNKTYEDSLAQGKDTLAATIAADEAASRENPTPPTPTPRSWAPEVIADNSGKWCGNGLRFKERGDAEEWVADLADRWTLVREIRVVESDEEPNR